MNEHLKSLNQSYVFAYILNYQPASSTDIGALTIVDNSEGNISYLLSSYGFYIDNIFIAGGHGYRTKEELATSSYINSSYNAVYNEITEKLEDLATKKTIFTFKGTETADIGNNEVNLNILSPEYNSYNFITSYKYFKVDESIDSETSNLKYVLSLNSQDDIRYIENIKIEPNNTNDNDVIDIENINASNTQKYKIKLSIDQKTSSNVVQYNENLKLYLYSKISGQYKDEEIEYNKDASNISLSCEFNKPSNNFNDDLVFEIRKSSQEIIYSYIIPNFLKWQDKFIIYPISSSTIIQNLNNYNFRDTNTNLNDKSIDIFNVYKSLVDDNFNDDNFINVDTNNEIELEFSSNTPIYDYIIFRNQYDVEFYFNGLKSNNWVCETITINSKTYYIWQSPQKYVGNHIWKIKINI